MRYIIIFIFIGIFTSCSSKEEEVNIPKNLIPRDSLVSVLVDIHIADAYLAKHKLPADARNKTAFYDEVLKKHGYNRQVFDSTISYLKDYLDYYQDIYDDVLNELSKKEAYIQKEKADLKRDKRKKEKYLYQKTINNGDTIVNKDFVTDSAFLERVSQAKKRFNERKLKKQKKKK